MPKGHSTCSGPCAVGRGSNQPGSKPETRMHAYKATIQRLSKDVGARLHLVDQLQAERRRLRLRLSAVALLLRCVQMGVSMGCKDTHMLQQGPHACALLSQPCMCILGWMSTCAAPPRKIFTDPGLLPHAEP